MVIFDHRRTRLDPVAIVVVENLPDLPDLSVMNVPTHDRIGISFAIVDTGIGIAPDKIDRIFNKFSQAEESTTRRFGGTGLGLSISQKLATMMGGTIRVASVVDQGSTFTFDISLKAGEPQKADAAPRAISALQFTNTHVLIVEDIAVNVLLMRKILEKYGCKVSSVVNGREAVTAVRSNVYDLVFMDCQMPEMDGFEATRNIRANEAGGRHVPIIALTADAMVGDREKCIAAGMDDYLNKPLRVEKVAMMLKKWLPAAV
jgi:CheY-like chemotaxis protein